MGFLSLYLHFPSSLLLFFSLSDLVNVAGGRASEREKELEKRSGRGACFFVSLSFFPSFRSTSSVAPFSALNGEAMFLSWLGFLGNGLRDRGGGGWR